MKEVGCYSLLSVRLFNSLYIMCRTSKKGGSGKNKYLYRTGLEDKGINYLARNTSRNVDCTLFKARSVSHFLGPKPEYRNRLYLLTECQWFTPPQYLSTCCPTQYFPAAIFFVYNMCQQLTTYITLHNSYKLLARKIITEINY